MEKGKKKMEEAMKEAGHYKDWEFTLPTGGEISGWKIASYGWWSYNIVELRPDGSWNLYQKVGETVPA